MRRRGIQRSVRRALLCAAVGVIAAPGKLDAGNVWDGGGSNSNWTTGANWNSDNLPPANNGSIDVVMAGTTRLTPNVNVAYDIRGLIFNFDAGAFTLSGQELTIGAGGILQGDTQTQRIDNAIQLSANQTWDAFSGPLYFAGTINLGGITRGHALNVSGDFATTISRSIEGSGSLVKFGASTLTLTSNAANTYGGNTTVNSGTLVLAKAANVIAVPGNLIIGDGTGTDVVKVAQWEQIADTSSVTINSSGVLELAGFPETTGPITVNGGSIISAGGQLVVYGGLFVNGGGVSFADANLYSDVVSIGGGGTISLNGTSALNSDHIAFSGGTVTGGVIRTNIISSTAAATPSQLFGSIIGEAASLHVNVQDGAAVDDLIIGGILAASEFSKDGSGQLVLTGGVDANLTSITGGTVVLNGSFGNTLNYNVMVGNVAGPQVVLRYERDGQLAPGTTRLTVRNSGLIDLNGHSSSCATLELLGGNVINANGFHANRVSVPASNTVTPTIGGILAVTAIGAASTTFDVANSPLAIDLDVPAGLVGSSFGTLTMIGAGTTRLGGSGSFAGTVRVEAGTVLAANNAAFGVGTVVLTNGIIAPDGGDRTIANSLSVAGNATIAGSQSMSWNGPISIAATSTLNCANSATVTLGGAHAHALGATVNANAGVVRITQDAGGAALARNLAINLNGASTQVHFESSQHLAALDVNGSRAEIRPGGQRTLVTGSLDLDVANGLVDVWEHAIVIDYTIASSFNFIRSAILSAYSDGNWTGFGITSSMADQWTHGIGYAESSSIFSTFPATFEGEPIDNTAILIKLTRYGDANLDGVVNAADLGSLASHWQQSSQYWTGGDFTYDGRVDLLDLYLLATNWQAGASLGAPLDSMLASLGMPADRVPEPAAAVFCLVPLLLLRRRRFDRFLP